MTTALHKLRVVGIGRAPRFSPNAEAADEAILRAVLHRLGTNIPLVNEEQWPADHCTDAHLYVSMARDAATLHRLSALEQGGAVVVNAPGSLRSRSSLQALMVENGIPVPPTTGLHGTWLKRGDMAAQQANDVVFCPDSDAEAQALQAFAARGVQEVVKTAHVEGDVVKWYGVGNSFFKYYYPADDGISKFGHERLNGTAHHYAFDVGALQQAAAQVAALTGMAVYGGDAIVDSRGHFYLIDFNDWPSFSRCREEAAEAIAQHIIMQLNNTI